MISQPLAGIDADQRRDPRPYHGGAVCCQEATSLFICFFLSIAKEGIETNVVVTNYQWQRGLQAQA